MNVTKKIGLLLTGIWLILMGLAAFVSFIPAQILAALAVVWLACSSSWIVRWSEPLSNATYRI